MTAPEVPSYLAAVKRHEDVALDAAVFFGVPV
jgi:hypothetical protein